MTILISVTPRQPPRIESITVEIPIAEVFALEAVLSNVSGPPRTSRRGLCDNILRVLNDATRDEKAPSHADAKGSFSFSARKW